MSLQTFYYEPFYSLDEFHSLFDDAFRTRTGSPSSQAVARPNNNVAKAFKPKLDLHESKDGLLTATIDLPGFKKEDISIDVHNNRLTISGDTTSSTETKAEDGYVVRERHHGKFSRSIPLPVDVEADKIKASVSDGILTITFPKAAPEQGPKKIAVE